MSRRHTVFGITPAGALVGERLELVEQAWARLCVASGHHCVDGGDKIPLAVMLRHYDSNRHPLVARGWTARSRLQDLFETSFKKVAVDGPEPGDYVTHDAFIDFYVKLSAEVQVMRQKGEAALDPDAFFCTMVSDTWHLDEEWGIPGRRKTVVAGDKTVVLAAESDSDDECHNSNMDHVLRPTAVKALQSVHRMPTELMDLVWVGTVPNVVPERRQLVGFRCVVQPLFPRAMVPPILRGHFLLAAESAENKVRYVPTRPTNQPPLDFVWEDEESGKLIGLRGAISSAVDLVSAPEEITRHLMTPAQSKAADVEFLPGTATPPNTILFKRINDEYGTSAVEEARRTAKLKKDVFEGTACGNVYATTWSGKFSDQFPGGPWRQASLNCSATKPRVELGSWKSRK